MVLKYYDFYGLRFVNNKYSVFYLNPCLNLLKPVHFNKHRTVRASMSCSFCDITTCMFLSCLDIVYMAGNKQHVHVPRILFDQDEYLFRL